MRIFKNVIYEVSNYRTDTKHTDTKLTDTRTEDYYKNPNKLSALLIYYSKYKLRRDCNQSQMPVH